MRFLISAGPTREYLDPVRFLSNPSSGKMGIELARAASKLGHAVILVHGPCSVKIPSSPRIRCLPVTTALQMRRAVLKNYARCDCVVMAAAVTDFRPRRQLSQKIKKDAAGSSVMKLIQNPDILLELGKKRKHPILVGFSAETHRLTQHALVKLRRKNLDCIVANRVGGRQSAFGASANKVSVLHRKGNQIVFGRMSKASLARRLIRLILQLTKR